MGLIGGIFVSRNSNTRLYQIINLVTVFAVIILNALANTLPFFGVTSGEVSDAFPNLFTPPGYVFSIWGVIYTTAIVFAIYQVRPIEQGSSYLKEVGFFYLIGGIINVSWLLLFHYAYSVPSLFVFTPILIGLFFVKLLLIYLRVGIGIKSVPVGEQLAVHLHISIYIGWISLATIANIASTLNLLIPGIPIDIQALWTALVLVVALVIASLMIIKRRDFAYGLVVVWASIGIATKQAAIPIINLTALAVAVLIIILILIVPVIRKQRIDKYYLVRE